VFDNLDELAKGIAENDDSRRQAIRWAGYSVLGAALSSMGFAETAEALTRRQRRRCRRKGGTPLERGECHCGFKCDSEVAGCAGDPTCTCFETPSGGGFCGRHGSCDTPCTTTADCPAGTRCAVNTCCGEPICVPECSSPPAAASTESGGPTSNGR
jgi:hypothetical protein